MRYLIAILLPPLAVLLCGRPLQAVLNLVLTLCFWLPGAAHALVVVFDQKEEERARRVVNAIRAWQVRAAVR